MSARGKGHVGVAAPTLTALNLVVAATFAGLANHAHQPGFTALRVIGFTVGFAVVGLFPMRLEFGRHQVTFTLTDSVLVAALFAMGPVGVGLAAAVGESLSCAVHRVSLLKTMFNSANRLGSATIAATAFFVLGGTAGTDLRGWSAALLAAGCFSMLNMAAVAGVLARAEGRGYQDIFCRSAPTALGTTFAAAPLGLIGVDLFNHSEFAPLLLVPLVVAIGLNNRYAAAQRDEHLRVERLYEATSRAARLTTFEEAVASVANEGRRLLTGVAAVCCAPDASGDLVGVIVDDTGAHTQNGPDTRALAALIRDEGPCEVGSPDLPDWVRALAPSATRAVLAQSPAESPVPVTLVVFRGSTQKDARRGQVETLSAFAAQGSLTIGNARLYEEVGEALRLQVDLNRQKTDFVAAVSHELRTPLSAMLGAVQTMVRLKDKLNDDDRDRFLQMSLDQGTRLKRLIEDLLLVAAAEHGVQTCERAAVDLGELLAAVARELGSAVDNRLDVRAPRAGVRIYSDEQRLHQVLVNLVGNATKYAPTGPIELTVSLRGSDAVLKVIDHGPGIAPLDRRRVFERFVQLDQSSTRRQGGTGLGLYLSRQLAQQLGGTLEVDDTFGGGATFTLKIPSGQPTRGTPSTPDPREVPLAAKATRSGGSRDIDQSASPHNPAGSDRARATSRDRRTATATPPAT